MNWQSKYYHSVDIVLAVYNGERYLEEQLNSLKKNKDYAFLVRKVIVVDDGSTDDTLAILSREAKENSKIKIVSNASQPLGAMRNFSRGAELTQAEFVMFCDQDDVWFETKIIETLSMIVSHKNSKPKLVFTDLHIVNNQLELIYPSYFKFKKIKTNWHNELGNLVKQNVVSGCTMMANRSLLDRALPIPQEAYMHDWWLALIAKIEGELLFIDKPLMLYRQHESNTIGAVTKKKYHIVNRLKRFLVSVDKSILQTKKLLTLYPELKETKDEAVTLSQIPSFSLLARILLFMKGRYRRSSFLGTLAMLFYLLFFAKGWDKRVAKLHWLNPDDSASH